MPPQVLALAGTLVWNYHRDRAGKLTLSQFGRAHPFVFIFVMCWLIPHVLIGSHLTDRLIRAVTWVRR